MALGRISTFLAEDEVTDQVSSLKQQGAIVRTISVEDQRLGIERASFKWNEVEEEQENKDGDAPLSKSHKKVYFSDTESEPVPGDSVSINNEDSDQERRFELRDVSIVFPDGQLTVITGPSERNTIVFVSRPEPVLQLRLGKLRFS